MVFLGIGFHFSKASTTQNETPSTSSENARAGLRSFTTDASGRIRYVDQSPTKHESIWAKEDGTFEDWAK